MKQSKAVLPLVLWFVSALGGGTTVAAQKPGDGIRVHGHWSIEVRNPDGGLVSHNEFENALTPDSGAVALSSLLGVPGSFTVSSWQLRLFGAGGINGLGPCKSAGVSVNCGIVDPSVPVAPGDVDQIFPTLAFSQAASQQGGVLDTVEVTGNVTASFAEPITGVSSMIQFTNGSLRGFSDRTLATSIQVAVGQKIYVKVVFSFS